MMDNRVFNINGEGEQMLLRVLQLAFEQEGMSTAIAYKIDPKKGMIIYWHHTPGKTERFPSQLKPQELAPLVMAWLKSEEAESIECIDWDEDYDHDGHNVKGWRVFCEDWGHVNEDSYVICAVKPAYLWLGK